MKFKDIVFIVLLIAACGFFYMLSRKENNTATDKKIDSLVHAYHTVLHFDSVKTAMMKELLDSVHSNNVTLDKKLDKLHNENATIRKQNAELEKNYRSLIVDRPDF